jgi:cytochrome oxidase Cu insertion factor (SCO1/SenC/PrrC family)
MRRARALVIVLAIAMATYSTVAALQSQPSPAAVNVDAVGPQLGTKVPDFTLPDQFGRQHSLSTLTGPKGLVLVFNRSAEW